MLAKITDWLGRFWKFIVGLAVVVGLLTGLTSLIEFRERRQDISSPTVISTSTAIATMTPTLPPTPTATMGPFQFITLPEEITAGEDIVVRVQALADAVCHLDYFTPNGNLSIALDSNIVIPDSRAVCTWEWHIRADTMPGIAKLVITINDMKETHEFEILPGD